MDRARRLLVAILTCGSNVGLDGAGEMVLVGEAGAALFRQLNRYWRAEGRALVAAALAIRRIRRGAKVR